MNSKEIVIRAIKDVNTLSEKRDYNRYIKKYPMEKMFMFLLCQQYSGIEYGRAFTLYLNQMIGDTTDIVSQSELSKKLRYRLPIELFKEMYELLLYQAKGTQSKELRRIKRLIRIIDSTALPATSSMDFAKHRRSKNGFKLHTVINGDYFPESVTLKNGRSSDKKSLKWAIREGYIHIFDRGYNDYGQFRWITEKNAHFVTRALGNIQYTTLQNRKVGYRQKEKGILSDRYIEVIEDRKIDSRFCMRMVTFGFVDATGTYREFSLLTDLIDHRSDDITELYRERWNIEVMFRWIKTFLKIDHWLSRSINGVLIQIYTALCAYLMVLIAKMRNSKKYSIMKDSIYEFIRELKTGMKFFEPGSNIEELFLEVS